MASLDTLAPDQRAVLDLVLRRGRGYDEIARLLSIDRAAVRARALAALDALGPQTAVSPGRRALITDYLLGQLPHKVSDEVRARLAESAGERAWARVVASELAPVSSGPLPQIPPAGEPGVPAAAPAGAAASGALADHAVPAGQPPTEPSGPTTPGEPSTEPPGRITPPGQRPPKRTSRLGGAILLGGGAAVVAAVVVVILLGVGRSNHQVTVTTTETSAAASTPATTATSTTSAAAKVIAQVNLRPASSASKAIGIAQVVREGSAIGIVITATGVPANTKHNAYAVWLYNSPTDNDRLGFVNPGVGSNGKLQTAGALPSDAAKYKELLVTLETEDRPKSPGPIVLEGALSIP